MKTTKVVFRKYPSGEMLALFPYENWNGNLVTSYQHIGQHGSADYKHCIDETFPASPEEYENLKKELEGIGYMLYPIYVDTNGREIFLTQDVRVYADSVDWTHEEFHGRVTGFKDRYVLVTDQEDDTFCVDQFNIEIE